MAIRNYSEETYTMLSILLFLTGSVLHVTVLCVLHFFFMMSEIYIYIELLTRCLLFAEVCIWLFIFTFHTGRNIDEKYLKDCLALKCAVKNNITCITLFGKDTELYIFFQIHKAYELFFKLWSHTSWCMVQNGNTYLLIC